MNISSDITKKLRGLHKYQFQFTRLFRRTIFIQTVNNLHWSQKTLIWSLHLVLDKTKTLDTICWHIH